MEKPKLEKAIFHFSQEGNCIDGEDNIEFLEIRCESSCGIDNDEGCFYVLKTRAWSIDSTKEIQELFDRIQKIIKHDNQIKEQNYLSI